MTTPSTLIVFREEQPWRHVTWVILLVFGLAAFQWYGFIEQIILGRPFGNNPAPDWVMILIWLFFGVGLPIFFLRLRLVVIVRPESIDIDYRPLTRRSIPMDTIVGVEARDYRPLAEYGGWGIRGWGNRIAYNVRGNRGVDLTLIDGRRVLIGSQRANELATAILAMRSRLG